LSFHSWETLNFSFWIWKINYFELSFDSFLTRRTLVSFMKIFLDWWSWIENFVKWMFSKSNPIFYSLNLVNLFNKNDFISKTEEACQSILKEAFFYLKNYFWDTWKQIKIIKREATYPNSSRSLINTIENLDFKIFKFVQE